MFRSLFRAILILSFPALSYSQPTTEKETGWRISPQEINIEAGTDRRLQLLDDLAQELHGAEWSVNEPGLAEIQEEDGRVVVHAKAAGTVQVCAARGQEKRYRDIRIFDPNQPLPPGTTRFGIQPIGRGVGDIAAVPTPEGPNIFSLEQTAGGSTYLRAVAEDGIQIWAWLMPEKTHDVELVCGDWLGGALISANRGDSYTLYTVASDGKLRWQHTLPGMRKAHAYNLEHLVHVLSQSADGKVTRLTGFDGNTGAQKFDLTIPPSSERRVNVRTLAGRKILCVQQSGSSPQRTLASRLFVNIDGFAYLAFTQNDWTLEAPKCTPGSTVEPSDVKVRRDERVVLWQIHPDGTYRSTIVEEFKGTLAFTDVVRMYSPTGALVPDGLGGELLSMRWSNSDMVRNVIVPADELVYRIDENGTVEYRMPLPAYDGPLKDEMVLGEGQRGFVTRGSVLVAFNVQDGGEIWRWDSHTPGIEVFAALANGGCAVQTPTALVEVDNSTDSKEIFKGKAMLDWQGNLYRKLD